MIFSWRNGGWYDLKNKNKCKFPFYFFMFSLDLGKEWVCLFLFHNEFYIRIPIVFILGDFGMINIFFFLKILSVSYFKRWFSFAYPRVALHNLFLGGASRFIKAKWKFSLGFLILWVRSQLTIYYLAYLMNLSVTRFFLISNFDSYVVD